MISVFLGLHLSMLETFQVMISWIQSVSSCNAVPLSHNNVKLRIVGVESHNRTLSYYDLLSAYIIALIA